MAFEAKIREGLQPQGSLEVADVAVVICFGEAAATAVTEDMLEGSLQLTRESHSAELYN